MKGKKIVADINDGINVVDDGTVHVSDLPEELQAKLIPKQHLDRIGRFMIEPQYLPPHNVTAVPAMIWGLCFVPLNVQFNPDAMALDCVGYSPRFREADMSQPPPVYFLEFDGALVKVTEEEPPKPPEEG